MRLKEAIRHPFIRRSAWVGSHVHVDTDSMIILGAPWEKISQEDVQADDWEVYVPGPPKLTFAQALEAMSAGKRVRLPDWQPGATLRINDGGEFCMRHQNYAAALQPFPALSAALRKDWQVAE